MKTTFTLLIIALSLTISGQNSVEIARIGIKSTVSIVALDNMAQPLGYGSGFIIDDELIATNVHVIEGCNSAYVLINGEEKKYKVSGYVSIDKPNDLVILKVAGLLGTALPLGAEAPPEIGEKIYAIGNPKGFNGTFSEGIVSGIRTLQSNQVLQITAPISPGSSGGPVLSSTGQVIGIAFASYSSGQNLNFAIPVKYLINLKSAINKIEPLVTVKPQVKINSTTSIEPNIKEGVSIRNISTHCTGSTFEDIEGKLYDFSIKNNLSYTLSDIKILFLAYDATNTIVDYREFTYSEQIKPLLAKSFECMNGVVLSGSITKVKARILDFKIIEE